MADSELEALTARGALLRTDLFYVVDPVSGLPYKATAADIATFADPLSNGSVAAQVGFSTDTYLAGSNPLNLAAGRLKAGSGYRCRFDIAKTAAGTAAAVITVRMGTAGTTADTARLTFTFPTAQTAAIDNGYVDILLNFRTVGTGTTAVAAGFLTLNRTNTTTGFLSTGGLQNPSPLRVTSAGFDSSTVTQIGVSVNAGATGTPSWTVTAVQSELKNLA